MLGEVVGCDEDQYVRLEAFEGFVVEDFDRGIFDGRFIRSAWPLSGMRSAAPHGPAVPERERAIW